MRRRSLLCGVAYSWYGLTAVRGAAPQVGDATFSGSPAGLAVDAAGNLFIVLTERRVWRLDARTGALSRVEAVGGPQFGRPSGVAVDAAGSLFIADPPAGCVRKIANGILTTVAGTGVQDDGGDGGAAASTPLSSPAGVAVDAAGNLYIADWANHRVRKVSQGIVTTVAGNGTNGAGGDGGPAVKAQLSSPSGVAIGPGGELYIADLNNARVRRVANGIVTTVAGSGAYGYAGDNGPATRAQLSNPAAVAVDAAGDLYIADLHNACVRKVSKGVITTVAGNGTAGYSGDGGPATAARLAWPRGVAVDAAGSLFIADHRNSCVRKVANGVITTVAGKGPQ